MHKWVRPLVALVILSVSTLFLSAILDNLSPYLAMPSPQEKGPPEKRVPLLEENRISPPSQMPIKPGHLIFAVSPADPVLYWRTTTADYYNGVEWYKTTRQVTTHEFPSVQESDATQFFTVELNMTDEKILLPVPPAKIDLRRPVLFPTISHEFYSDEIGDTYGVRALGLGHAATIIYQAGWHYTEIDKWLVSLDDAPQEILEFYLQLPSLPAEVVQLAQKLKRPAMNVVDQILSDVAYFLLHFEYDLDYYMGRTRRTISTDWVLSYLQWGKGLCLDAATALAVILRCQGIPSRLSLGYKPTRIDGDKVLYYSNTSHAETEAYLPPYGWVRFDPTPPSPLDLPEDFGALRPEKGLALELSPTEAEGYPGDSVFYHLIVNNSRETKDNFELSTHSRDKWDCEITPESLSIRPFESRNALIEVKIPEDASYGQADILTVTATSTYDPDTEISTTTITRVGATKRLPTVTNITYINNPVFRGDDFYVEGTVSTTDHKPVHDMCVLILFKESKEGKGIVCGNGFSKHGLFDIEGQVPFDAGLGYYAVVAISLGNTEYAPSSNDPSVEVMARTYIELDICVEDVHITRPFLVEDHVLISGSLRLDNGTTLLDTILELEVLAPGSRTTGKHKITTEHGFFLKKFMFSVPGTYELNATFFGKEHIAGSYSSRKIEVGSPLVQILTEDYCVRGEVLSISGNVSSNNNGIPKEPVTIAFDGEDLATVETGLEGAFFYNWKIDSEVQPGWHLLEYVLLKRTDIGATQYVRTMIRAQLTINAPQEVTGEDPLTCAISLHDDHGFPIDGEEIFVGTHGLSSKTDKRGNVELMLDTLPLWCGKMNLTVSFEGSDKYLPSTMFVVVAVQPGFVSVLLALTTSSLLIIGFAANRGKFKKFSDKGKHDESDLEEVSIPTGKKTPQIRARKVRVLEIKFPDIRTPFPNVWGIRDRLRIECTLNRSPRLIQKRKEIELFVDNKRISKDGLSKNGPATFSYIFDEKGEHEVGVSLVRKSHRLPMKYETKLRIVEYREEIIRLYKTFLQHLVNHGMDVKDEMTAREVERLLAGTDDSNLESLQKVMDCFEKAEYSDHEVIRENYETMYLSLKELIIDVD